MDNAIGDDATKYSVSKNKSGLYYRLYLLNVGVSDVKIRCQTVVNGLIHNFYSTLDLVGMCNPALTIVRWEEISVEDLWYFIILFWGDNSAWSWTWYIKYQWRQGSGQISCSTNNEREIECT